MAAALFLRLRCRTICAITFLQLRSSVSVTSRVSLLCLWASVLKNN